jgi:hypothetical protein
MPRVVLLSVLSLLSLYNMIIQSVLVALGTTLFAERPLAENTTFLPRASWQWWALLSLVFAVAAGLRLVPSLYLALTKDRHR